jgi:hypothetical protein
MNITIGNKEVGEAIRRYIKSETGMDAEGDIAWDIGGDHPGEPRIIGIHSEIRIDVNVDIKKPAPDLSKPTPRKINDLGDIFRDRAIERGLPYQEPQPRWQHPHYQPHTILCKGQHVDTKA